MTGLSMCNMTISIQSSKWVIGLLLKPHTHPLPIHFILVQQLCQSPWTVRSVSILIPNCFLFLLALKALKTEAPTPKAHFKSSKHIEVLCLGGQPFDCTYAFEQFPSHLTWAVGWALLCWTTISHKHPGLSV